MTKELAKAAHQPNKGEIELILGNSNSRFSGVTSTMLQVLPHQRKMTRVAVMGKHHLPNDTLTLSFREACKLCRTTLPDGRPRVFHARRNNEVLQALLMKKVFGAKLQIAFTSTAQRQHSWITRWLIKESAGVITTSAAANAFIERGADIIIPHGIDAHTYHPTENREQAWRDLGYPGKYGIGIFGRVRHQKGVDVFIKSLLPLMNKYSDFTAVICGETTPDNNNFETKLRAEISQAGLTERFQFIGKQEFTELPKLFRAMSLVAALSRNEGFGLTVLEAMASGAAVIASEAGAWKEIIRKGVDGHIVPCGDVEATTKQLDSLMSDVPTLHAMGARGRERVEADYTIEREAQALYNYLISLTTS